MQDKLTHDEQEKLPEQRQDPPTPFRTRVFAMIGVVLMIILVLAYTYSLATGKIFWM